MNVPNDKKQPVIVSTPASGSAYWEELEQKDKKRESLVETAILAVKKLSDHLDAYDDKRWWYRANESMNALWKIR
jgi:hypothetical protein